VWFLAFVDVIAGIEMIILQLCRGKVHLSNTAWDDEFLLALGVEVFFFFQAEDGIRDRSIWKIRLCRRLRKLRNWPHFGPLQRRIWLLPIKSLECSNAHARIHKHVVDFFWANHNDI